MAQSSNQLVIGTIAELSGTAVVVTDSDGGRWQVPRVRLPAGAAVGDRITLLVVPGATSDRDELARALLNELLDGA